MLLPKIYKVGVFVFKNNPDNMRMEPTPERVYSVCRLVAHENISESDIIAAISLNRAEATAVIRASIEVARNDLQMISNKDGKLVLSVAKETIESPTAFRRFVASRVFANRGSTFAMFSKWYISKNEAIFPLTTWDIKAKTAKQEEPLLTKLSENDALGWRFWAAFFGLGYLNGTVLIPNMKTRIQDVLATTFTDTYNYGEPVRAADFVAWLSSELPESTLNTPLPLAVSAGLRTLSDLELVAMEARRDTERMALFYVDGDLFNDFSHITVSEEVCK